MAAQLERAAQGQPAYIRYDCPYCAIHVLSGLTQLGGARDTTQESWAVTVCTNGQCRLPCVVKVTLVPQRQFGGFAGDEISRLAVQLLPAARPIYRGPGVPLDVVKDLTEALGCQAAGFYVAAAVVGRRALQAAVRERLAALGITPDNDNLFTEINALPDGVLPPQWKETAHEVRHLGNDGAHAEPVSPEEAEGVLTFTKGVLEQLYVLPFQLAASKAARQQKKAGQPGG